MLGGLDFHSIAVAVKRALTALGQLVTAAVLAPSTMGFSMVNGKLVPSQNGTVLTVAIKTQAGLDPSVSDPVYVLFRNATPTTGDYTVITLTAPTSISTTVGGTFGVANNVAFRLWVVGFNDGGVFRLALINCLSTAAGAGAGRDVTGIFPLAQFGIASSTQIGAGSVLSQTFYSFGAAVAAKAYATLGYLAYEAGLAAAGTFGVDESRTELFRAGVPLPGQVIQIQRNDTGAVTTGSTVIPIDDTIPQNTEGDQYMTQPITPSSAANVLKVRSCGFFSWSTASAINIVMALFQDATLNAFKAVNFVTQSNVHLNGEQVDHQMLAATSAATTFKIRAGPNSAGTLSFNGNAGARLLGGVLNSYIEVSEVMA